MLDDLEKEIRKGKIPQEFKNIEKFEDFIDLILKDDRVYSNLHLIIVDEPDY